MCPFVPVIVRVSYRRVWSRSLTMHLAGAGHMTQLIRREAEYSWARASCRVTTERGKACRIDAVPNTL
jgi:hypothetical protein